MLIKDLLLIVSNPASLAAYKENLVREGFQVSTAVGIEDGLMRLDKSDYQLVISDINFPDTDRGCFKIIEAARNVNPDCEIILIAGSDDFNLIIQAIHLDVSNFIPRPGKEKDLLYAINHALKRLEMRHVVKQYTEALKNIIFRKNKEIAEIEEKGLNAAWLSCVGDTTASICHELMQPISCIMALLFLLRNNGIDNPETDYMIGKIKEQMMSMKSLISTLHVFSMNNKGPSLAKIDINETIRSVTSVFNYQLKEQDIELVEELDSSLPLILGNRTRLQNALVKILANVRDALSDVHTRRHKRISIKTSCDKRDGSVQISISDNGPGIQRAMQGKIYLPLFCSWEFSGDSGMRLSACKSIVSDFNGYISLKSFKGKGSTLTLNILNGDDILCQDDVLTDKHAAFLMKLKEMEKLEFLTQDIHYR